MDEQFAGHKIFFPQYKKGKQGLQTFSGTILDHARKLGVPISAECGGQGQCGRCVVRIERGAEALSPLTEAERQFDLGNSERLACQARIVRPANLYVYVRSAGQYSILSDTVRHETELDPLVRRVDGEVIWLGPEGQRPLGPYSGGIYGLAIDVGTTTLVCQVLDLESGEETGTIARRNPQATYGDDVIARIAHTMQHDDGLPELQGVVIEAVNDMLQEFEDQHGIATDQIYEAVAVGNPTMRDLFFGRDVRSLGVIPFEAVSKAPLNVRASALGLRLSPDANVYGAALIGGHAGADCLADIIAARLHQAQQPCMLIDIGTNGEVAIGNADRIMTASCAAGAAYEGATVSHGVGAVEGAICNVQIRNDHVEYETIGGQPPVGICGSGLIDVLGELLKTGLMTKQAKLDGDFHVTDAISLSQADVYQLITAKAGLRTDQDLLLKYYGVDLQQLDKIYLAGGFGNYIDVDNAVAIGLLPDLKDRVVKIGNAALAGAAEMVLSQKIRRDSEVWALKVEHTKPNELEPEFVYMVAENMYF